MLFRLHLLLLLLHGTFSGFGLAFSLSQASFNVHDMRGSCPNKPIVNWNGPCLVQLSPDTAPVWINRQEVLEMKARHRAYVDITDSPDLGHISSKPKFIYPTQLNSSSWLSQMFPFISIGTMEDNLRHLTSFHTRHYDSEGGRASAEWIYDKASNYAASFANEDVRRMITLELGLHGWKQPTVLIMLKPPGTSHKDPTVILGAHADSWNDEGPSEKAPGADDDGSGVIGLLEVYRVILLSGYVPTTPIEFHFYSGGEAGIIGSQAYASYYEETAHSIKGMLQLESIAWVKNGTQEAIGLFQGGVDKDLTAFVSQLVDTYLDIPVSLVDPRVFKSDHFAWTRAGYPSAAVMESRIEDANANNIHSSHDTMDISPEFSFEHITHFVKLATAFVVELTNA